MNEIDSIVNQFWDHNFKFRIWSVLEGAEERNWVIDVQKIENDYHNRATNDQIQAMAQLMKDYPEKKEGIFSSIEKVIENKIVAEVNYEFVKLLIKNPVEVLNKLNDKLHKEIEWDDNIDKNKYPKFTVINAPAYNISNISSLNKKIRLVQLSGIIKSMSQPLMNIIEGVWECKACGHKNYVNGSSKPQFCEGCGKKSEFLFLEEESVMESYREIKLQELIDTPKPMYDTVFIEIPEQLISSFSLSDRVGVVGIIKMKSTNENKNKDKMVKETYIQAVNIFKINDEKIKISEEDIKKIEEFAKKEDVLDQLAEMYAPAIVGYHDIKKAIVLQAVGGNEKIASGTRVRGNIHLLLIGDPGTAKSQLLLWNKNLNPKAMYVADASGAGLTIAITKNQDQISWEAGVMVLANGSVACIDEIEKMREEDRQLLHPAMEQGIVSKSKGGFFITAPANTSVLAAANPKFGRFDTSKLLVEQVTLPPTLLNRFDLIFFITDTVGSIEKERDLAHHILLTSDLPDTDFLKKYIEYAKKFRPTISEQFIEMIAEKYAEIRTGTQGKIPINARNLQAIVRLAEASAKIRLSDTVNEKDIHIAFGLLQTFLASIQNDIDMVETEINSNIRTNAEKLLDYFKSYNYLEYRKVIEIAKSEGVEDIDIDRIIQFLKEKREITELGNGYSYIGDKSYA